MPIISGAKWSSIIAAGNVVKPPQDPIPMMPSSISISTTTSGLGPHQVRESCPCVEYFFVGLTRLARRGGGDSDQPRRGKRISVIVRLPIRIRSCVPPRCDDHKPVFH